MLKNCRDGAPERSQTSKTPGLQGGGQRDIPRRSPSEGDLEWKSRDKATVFEGNNYNS